jgi:hypothetical protein
LWLKTWNDGSNNVLLGKAFDIPYLGTIAMLNQGNGNAVTTSTTRTTDAVGVVFRFHWQAKVNYVTDAGHINAARSNVSGNQNLGVAFAQGFEATHAYRLWHCAVQCSCFVTIRTQGIRNLFAFHLGAGKHYRLVY